MVVWRGDNLAPPRVPPMGVLSKGAVVPLANTALPMALSPSYCTLPHAAGAWGHSNPEMGRSAMGQLTGTTQAAHLT